MSEPLEKIVIVGGGLAGLWTANEILRAANAAKKPIEVVVLTDKIHPPTAAGINVVLGIDGFGVENDEGKTPTATNPDAKLILGWVREGVKRVLEFARAEKLKSVTMGYQILGNDTTDDAKGSVEWLRDNFLYKKSEFSNVPGDERLKFAGYTNAMSSNAIGQMNPVEVTDALVKSISRMGGRVETGVRYDRHELQPNGTINIHTNQGVVMGAKDLVLATGAAHLSTTGIPIPPVKANRSGTIHVPMDTDDAAKVSKDGKPVAFCNSDLMGNVIYGALDNKGVLTIGFDPPADITDPVEARRVLEANLLDTFHKYLPELKGKYEDRITYSHGLFSTSGNEMPVVGKYGDVYVNAAWASRGAAQIPVAAKALALHFVYGNDRMLNTLHSLNPPVEAPLPAAEARPGAGPKAAKPA